jgi:ribosomal protein S18 acetylase RimI-like enzyme
MPIEYKRDPAITAEELASVFERSGIRRPVDDLVRMQRMLDAADLTFAAYDGEKLIGYARSLTDFCFCCYLSDLAVDKAYQRNGIGKELVHRVQSAIGEETAMLLLSAPDAMEYYPHIGFDKAENAWIIKRKR